MKYLPLSLITPLENEMKERGVSKVARSSRGFLTAYRDAGGRENRLSDWWQNRRDNFVKRHMAQVKKRDESLWNDDGRPSRRHLALIAWAYTPDKARVERYIKRLRKNPSQPILISPPPNESYRLRELNKILEQYYNRFNPDSMQESLDKRLAEVYQKVLRRHGYDYPLESLQQLVSEVRPEIMRHKEHFNALRPHQLAEKHGIPFEHDPLVSAQSPSYPSGHTTQAYYIAFVLGNEFPDAKTDLLKTANQIAQSRIDRGVHFPSDNEGGYRLAQELYARLARANPKPGSKADDRHQGQRAKPSERIKGSSVNKPGSATAQGSGSIKLSEKTEKALRKKVEDHNKKYGDTPSKRVTYRMLAAVYRRGAGAFSKSHRPGMQRAQWAFARVNHFLKIVRRGYPDDSKYIQDNDLLPKGHRRSTRENPMKQNPFKSQAQRRLFYAKMRDGEISPKVVREWERETGRRKLPERVNPSHKALKKYKDTHWGIEANGIMRKNDPDLPRELVEMGKLLEIGVIPETQEKPYAIAFPEYEKTSLAFSQGKDERLYAILPKRAEQAVKKAHWKPNEPTIRLGKVNKMTGGRMDEFRCPAIQVQVLGRANYVIYQTQKLDDVKEDGQASHYIHELGEESGILPYLCVAEDGTLWFAGGNYRVLNAGIAD